MKIILNGFEETVPDNPTITDLLEWAGEGDPDLIVEHNGKYIYPVTYSTCRIRENDHIEFINPNLGG